MNRVRLLPLLLAALSGLLLGSLPLSSAQAAPPEIEVSAPLLPLARWGGWVPVHVDIRTTEPVELTVDAHFLGGEPGTGTSRSLKLPRGAQRRVVLVVPVSGWAQELIVRVEGRRGVIHAASKLSLGTGSAALDSFHVAVVGEEPLGWPLVATATRLPVPGHPSISNQAERPVRVENLMPSDLPVHWFGYSPVDVLVWRRPDPSGLSPEQQAALRGWVASGGTLVLLLGDNHASWAASPLADLGGAQPRGLSRSPSALGVLWSLAGSGLPPGASKDPNSEDAPPVSGAPSLPIVELVPSAGASVRLEDAEGMPLVVRSRAGTGQVVLLGFDLAAGELRGGFDRGLFWRRLLGLWAPVAGELGVEESPDLALGPEPLAGHSVDPLLGACSRLGDGVPLLFGLDDATTPMTRLREEWSVPWTPEGWWSNLAGTLGDFQAAAPLSMTFVVVFGLLYLLCIGPVDYLVLRWLGRPMLTWVTFPALALGFALAAGVIITREKAGASETRCLGLVDYLPDAGVVRTSSWCALWASSRTALSVEVPRGQGWVLPSGVDDFPSPGDAAGYAGYDQPITGKDIAVNSAPGSSVLSFEAAQWSASTLRAAWIESSDGTVDWERNEDGSITVRSSLGVDLDGAWVIDGPRWYAIGALPDGEGRRGEPIEASLPEPGAAASGAGSPVSGWAVADVQTLWRYVADPIEPGPGHIHLGAPGQPLLLGLAAPGLASPRFEGLAGVDSSRAVVRVPLSDLLEEDGQ